MPHTPNQRFNYSTLARLLRDLRRKTGISRNQLAQVTGISRRTLARIETGRWSPVAGRGARTAFRLARALLGEEETERRLEEQTRLSRFLGPDPLYKYLDVLYHYPAFLFHDSPMQQALREEFGDDYRHSLDLLLRSGFGTRNLGARLRAFRLQHDLTLVETAALLGLSKSELHRLERAERSPSPRTRYRLLRLLTLPLEGHEFTRADNPVGRRASLEGARGNPRRVAPPLRPQRLGRAGEPTHPGGGVRSDPAAGPLVAKARAGSAGLKPRPASSRAAWLLAVRAALAARPPAPGETGDADPLARLRHAWLARVGLAGPLKTKELAAALGVSQPHLIRLLRGDRRPSKRLREQLRALTSRL